ncbi:hypothetical protein ACAW74_23800 [Fibrella sp. WM1]|uniref:hypothetical protein n=1 Tax=Fibrella musci TaxID=3242485 RepID=UPI0035203952
MNRLYVLLLLSLAPLLTLGQGKKTAITADFLGNTMVGANVHRNVGKVVNYIGRQTGFYSASLGLGYVVDGLFTLPHGLTVNLGAKSSYGEIGYAGTYFFRFSKEAEAVPVSTNNGIPLCGCVTKEAGPSERLYLPALHLGYRYQATGGFVFRLYGAVGMTNSRFYETFPRVMPGLSAGWSF